VTHSNLVGTRVIVRKEALTCMGFEDHVDDEVELEVVAVGFAERNGGLQVAGWLSIPGDLKGPREHLVTVSAMYVRRNEKPWNALVQKPPSIVPKRRRKRHRCTLCDEQGHNRRKCPNRRPP